MSKEGCTIDNVKYHGSDYNRINKKKESIQPLGIDTEAYITGKCFMIAISDGAVFQPDEFPDCMFSRKYRGKSFVSWNLKYDMGAFLQNVPRETLEKLRVDGKIDFQGFTYRAIANKCLTIRRGKNSIHIYDLYNFYNMSLKRAAEVYLNDKKKEVDTIHFWPFYVFHYWDKISGYCIQDAILTDNLARILIKRFEKYGVYPKKLYSVAYISYQYFRQKCAYVIVKRYWDNDREVLRYAMESYNGGKFEVTEKGTGYFYEYDIVSAYPFEISNLLNITWARVVRSKEYRKSAVYGFIRCKIDVPFECHSPVVMKRGMLNCYPVGQFERTITKVEYEYLIGHGADITIIDGYWLHLDNRQYPYRKEINRLTKLKTKFKEDHADLDYQTIKILMNSLYGKFVQLIKKEGEYHAGSNWNPIFGAIITANVRCRMSSLQSEISSCIAVHTDSIITKRRIVAGQDCTLGQLAFEKEGPGVILGSGIYQIGDKIKFRGFPLKRDLLELCAGRGKSLKISNQHAYTWREITFRGWSNELINRFETIDKNLDVNFDQKRLWIDDWNSFQDVHKDNVSSLPFVYPNLLV